MKFGRLHRASWGLSPSTRGCLPTDAYAGRRRRAAASKTKADPSIQESKPHQGHSRMGENVIVAWPCPSAALSETWAY